MQALERRRAPGESRPLPCRRQAAGAAAMQHIAGSEAWAAGAGGGHHGQGRLPGCSEVKRASHGHTLSISLEGGGGGRVRPPSELQPTDRAIVPSASPLIRIHTPTRPPKEESPRSNKGKEGKAASNYEKYSYEAKLETSKVTCTAAAPRGRRLSLLVSSAMLFIEKAKEKGYRPSNCSS